MSKPDPLKLKCESCGHENEPERVYCHNCGSKLDRSILPKIAEAKAAQEADVSQRRVKKMMTVRRGAVYNDIKIGIQVTLLSAMVAAMFLVWQKPEDMPESRKDHIPTVPIPELWDRLMANPKAIELALSEDDLNATVRQTLKASDGVAGIKFVRALVAVEPKLLTVYVERNAWGLPIYSNVTYKTVVADGKVKGEAVGIRIGKLGIHPAAAGFVSDWAVSGIWNAYQKEIKQSDRLSDIRLEDNKAVFVSKPL
jgi:hypothetical protein